MVCIRSIAFAPVDSALYNAHMAPAQVANFDPTVWDAAWIAAPAPLKSGLACPAWTYDSGITYGGNMACVWDVVSDNSANLYVVTYDPDAQTFSSVKPHLTSIPFHVNAGSFDVLRPGRAYGEKLLAAGVGSGDTPEFEMVVESDDGGATWVDITDSFPGSGEATAAFYI